MLVKIRLNEKGGPSGKLADAELHFTDGGLRGLKLMGFGVWERPNGSGRSVSLPARRYVANGEPRNFILLRPLGELDALDRIRNEILDAYSAQEAEAAMPR